MKRYVPRSHLMAIFPLLGGVLIAGCAKPPVPPVENVYRERTISPGALASGGVAVAGIVLAPDAHRPGHRGLQGEELPRGYRVQTHAWSPVLRDCLARYAPDLRVQPFARVEDNVPDQPLGDWLARLAEGRIPRPQPLASLRGPGLDVRYLITVRIESDNLGFEVQTDPNLPAMPAIRPLGDGSGRVTTGRSPGLGRISDVGRDEETTTWAAGPAVKRTMTLTLGVVDLAESRSIWEARVERSARKRIASEQPAAFDGIEVSRDSTVTVAEPPLADGPEFLLLLETCLGDVLEQLLFLEPVVHEDYIY